MRKCFVPLALALATLYLTLSVSAVACLFAHGSAVTLMPITTQAE